MEPDFSFETIVMSLPEPLIVLDKHEIIRVLNRAACELFDVNANSLLGTPVGRLAGNQGYYDWTYLKQKENLPDLNNLGVDQNPLFWTATLHNRIVELQATPLFNQENEKVGTIITVHKTSVEWTESAFIGMLFHDLRTPLESIIGSAELLLSDNTESFMEDREAILTLMRDAAKRLLEGFQNLRK